MFSYSLHALLQSISVIALILISTSPLLAEPKSCIGFNPENGSWGAQLRPTTHLCPKHYAFFGAAKPLSPNRDRRAAALGQCCPLPAEDILLDREVFMVDSCEEGMVATGVRVPPASESAQAEIRCTALNTARYQLGKAAPGALWGFDLASAPYFWKEHLVLKAADLPPAIRAGLARHDFREFSANGCVGLPFGSLLVAKYGKRCKHFYYRELQYRGAPNDPPAGTPVIMYPRCRYIADPFSPEAKCIE